MKKAVILEELGKCFLIAFLNNASPDKLINQIVLYLKCSYCEPNLSSPNKKKKKGEAVRDKRFYYRPGSFTDLFWIPLLYSATKRPEYKAFDN